MKEHLYLPLLWASLLTVWVLVTDPKRLKELFPPLQVILACGGAAMSPRHDWVPLAIGSVSMFLGLFLFIRALGFVPVAVSLCIATIIYAAFPDYGLFYAYCQMVALVACAFLWALAVRKARLEKERESAA